MKSGVLAGYPVVDVKVTLWDGSYHEVDSSEMAFKIAGSMASRMLCRKADPSHTRAHHEGRRRAPTSIWATSSATSTPPRQDRGHGGWPAQGVNAWCRWSEMFGYATDLRSKTQGRGQYSMEPAHYEQVPKSVADKIMAERTKG